MQTRNNFDFINIFDFRCFTDGKIFCRIGNNYIAVLK